MGLIEVRGDDKCHIRTMFLISVDCMFGQDQQLQHCFVIMQLLFLYAFPAVNFVF